MNHDLIRTWLGLPVGDWPPNHYQLLGLEPGEGNVVLIEQRAQQRLDAVRCYQLAHPEPATEALNRLAQAYICLTEPAAKRRYDETLLGDHQVALDGERTPLPSVSTDTPVPGKLLLPNRMRGAVPPPLPLRHPPPSDGEIVVPGISPEEEILDDAAIEATLPPLIVPQDEPTCSRACPLEEAARSRVARVGLCTRRGILRRIQTLRALLRAWNNIGRLLPTNRPGKKLNQKAQAQALVRNLTRVEKLLDQFPPLLGQAGQPGFLVLSLHEQDLTAKKLHSLDPAQRDKLREDWEMGYSLLRAHGRLLSELVAGYRGLGFFGRMAHALRSAMVHQPVVAASLFTLVGVNLLLWGWYAYRWWGGQSLLP